MAQFVLHCQRVLEGKKESKGDGVLIFDEVKVISRLMEFKSDINWSKHDTRRNGVTCRYLQDNL